MSSIGVNNTLGRLQRREDQGCVRYLQIRVHSVSRSQPSMRACFIEDRKESQSCWEVSFHVDLEKQTNALSLGRSPTF